jgi:flagellar hook-basal body complex protein FliE
MNEIGLISGGAGKALFPSGQIEEPQGAGARFGDVLQASLERVNQLQTEADTAVDDLTIGRQTDIHATMIAVEKAGIALELALQIRNKLLNAYETLMRQQI